MSFSKGEKHSYPEEKKLSPKAIKAKRSFTILRLFAPSLIFISWIFQNYIQKRWEGMQQESTRYRGDASYVQQQETHLKYYIGLFTSLYYKDINSVDSINHKGTVLEFMKSRLQGAYYDYSLTLLLEEESMAILVNVDKTKYSDKWLQDIRDSINNNKNQLLKLRYNDINFWNNYSSKLSENVWNIIPPWYEHINKFDDSIAKKIKITNTIFLWLYIFGSLLFAFAYYIKYKADKLGYPFS